MDTEKLYSPVNFQLRDKEDARDGVYDDINYWRDELSHDEAMWYAENIEAFLARDRQSYDNGRGLAEYIHSGTLQEKVQSLVPGIQQQGEKLWIVANIQLNEPLSQDEMAALKDWWSGQLSDGWGEGIEQREIKVDRGDLYLEPWTSDGGFFIDTEQDFMRRIGLEPPETARPEQALPSVADTAAPEVALDKDDLNALKLTVRLDQNLSDYHASIIRLDKQDIIGKASEIAAMSDAHSYMTEHHSFTTSEVDYLLKFQNPLEVVSDAWYRRTEDITDMSFALHEVFDKQDALADYPLISDAPAPTVKEVTGTQDALFERIAKHHCFFETLETRNRDSLDFREVSVWGMKSALEEAYEAGLSRQLTQTKGMDQISADRAESDMTPAAKDSPQSRTAEKPSVLAQLRDAAKEVKARPAEPDKSAPKKHEPEL